MKDKFITFFSDVAKQAATLSHAKRLQVGAIIVKNEAQIISVGYNGMPAGWDNNCEFEVDGKLTTKPQVIHAEDNAIAKVARFGPPADGCDMFVTHAPCVECAKAIVGSGISRVFFKEYYRDEAGLYFLETCGVEIVKV